MVRIIFEKITLHQARFSQKRLYLTSPPRNQNMNCFGKLKSKNFEWRNVWKVWKNLSHCFAEKLLEKISKVLLKNIFKGKAIPILRSMLADKILVFLLWYCFENFHLLPQKSYHKNRVKIFTIGSFGFGTCSLSLKLYYNGELKYSLRSQNPLNSFSNPRQMTWD